jgi:hypothetical protein
MVISCVALVIIDYLDIMGIAVFPDKANTPPHATAAAASARVLKNLAAQSHLSRRSVLSSVLVTAISGFISPNLEY